MANICLKIILVVDFNSMHRLLAGVKLIDQELAFFAIHDAVVQVQSIHPTMTATTAEEIESKLAVKGEVAVGQR